MPPPVTIALDSRHVAVPTANGYRLRQYERGVGGRYRESLSEYANSADALRDLIAETVKWGTWQ